MNFAKQALPLLLKNLNFHLQRHTGQAGLAKAYSYALLPPGKCFRPLLTAASFEDFHGNALKQLTTPHSDISKVCSSVEIHHAYTLVHDDLPCMDNDDIRRGKPSLHKAYGEWQAILTGDGLLNISHALLADLQTPLANLIRKGYSWALGPKGLIHGQYLDLSGEIAKSFPKLLTTHQLKTARLIQISINAGYLSGVKRWTSEEKTLSYKLYRLGHYLGIVFQLLDDLSEFGETLSPREKEINPWLCYYGSSHQELRKGLKFISQIKKRDQALSSVYLDYFQKMKNLITKHQNLIELHLGKSKVEELLIPIIAILK